MPAPLHVVILAAGEGKRMKSALRRCCRRSRTADVVARALAATRTLQPAGIHVVHGHGGDAVQRRRRPGTPAAQAGLQWVVQAQQLGTGHALQQAMPQVPDGAQVLVLYGDVPLIAPATLQRLLDAPGLLAVLAAEPADPTATGASCAMPKGRVAAIVEQKDADDGQRRIAWSIRA